MKLLVVACNSIEVSAIGDIATAHGVPVIGVINPGARAATRATRNGVVGVIGTEATIETGAYQRAIGSAVELHAAACPVFVEHVERGDTTSDELRMAARGYLAPLRERGIDTLILGCTHYPLLSGLLQAELGPDVVLVSSAEETAKDVYAELRRSDRLREDPEPPAHAFRTTGDAERVPRSRRAVPGARRRRRRRRCTSRWERGREADRVGCAGHLAGRRRRVLRLPGRRQDGFHLWLDAGTGTFARLQEHLQGRARSTRC